MTTCVIMESGPINPCRFFVRVTLGPVDRARGRSVTC
jgi:hypothetical protein